jgi:hypothetical protein
VPVPQHNAESLISEVQALARRLDAPSVSRSTWRRETGISDHHVLKHFDSWNEFVGAAGLKPDDRSRVADQDLFEAMRVAFIDAGGIVTRTSFGKYCRYGDDVYAKRWGRWQNVLATFAQWAQDNHPDFPYLVDLPAADSVREEPSVRSGSVPAWESVRRTQYGPFLNFRGLQHAPINEQGVVFLFGMVAFDLGYVVEGVGTGFPDCEAKRCVSRNGDVWERVSIEFEFRSRNFLAHGHDARSCDVIVCWEHNWPDCPIEVLELRGAIDQLDS